MFLAPNYFSSPDNQCMMLIANCRLSRPGRFIPKGVLFGPANCAESIAASPSTTMRPLPNFITRPCARPAADWGALPPRNTSTAESASLRKAKLSGGPFND